jgi:hypothetical protein
MGCVETKDFKEFEATINNLYSNTRKKFFGNKKKPQEKELKLIIDLKVPSSYTLFTKTNDLKPFGKDRKTNKSKSYLKVDKSLLFVEDSWISSICKDSSNYKISS